MAVTDRVVEECGSFGKYQIYHLLIIALVFATTAAQFLVVNFHNFEPEFRCDSPGWNNNNTNGTLLYQNLTKTEKYSYICTRNGTKCDKFVYSKDRYAGNTLVTEFDLVCYKKSFATISTTVFTCCLVFGALAGGILADRIGRKWTIVLQTSIASAACLALIFTQNMYMYVVLRGVVGFCYCGTLLVITPLALEVTGPRKRALMFTFIGSGWPFGAMSLSLIAYFQPDWNHIQIYLTVLSSVTFLSTLLLKESPHYLVGKGRYDEAETVLKSMARMNRRRVDDREFDRLRNIDDVVAHEKLVSIFKAKTLLKRSIIVFYFWFVLGLSSFGLSFNVKNMSGNIFINNVLMEGVGLLHPIVVILTKCFGRRAIATILFFVGSAALFIAAMLATFTDVNDPVMSTAILVVSLIGKATMPGLFMLNYIWCNEIFPTTLRASLGGSASLLARVGSAFSPLIVDMYKYVDTSLKSGFGPLLFSIAMLLAAILTFFLPETNNTRVPETIQEANIFLTEGHIEEFQAVKKSNSAMQLKPMS